MHAVGKLVCLVWAMWTVGVGELAGQTVVVQDETGRAMPVEMVQWSCLESEAVDVFTNRKSMSSGFVQYLQIRRNEEHEVEEHSVSIPSTNV